MARELIHGMAESNNAFNHYTAHSFTTEDYLLREMDTLPIRDDFCDFLLGLLHTDLHWKRSLFIKNVLKELTVLKE